MEDTLDIYTIEPLLQSGVSGLTNDKAYRQFLNDIKKESPMVPHERRGLMEVLRSQGRKLNRLMEIPMLDIQF